MSDRTAEFFDGLNRRGHVPALDALTATIRFDLEHDHGTDHWFVAISGGNVQVSRKNGDADAVVRVSKELFDRTVSGEASLFAAWVRNECILTGEVRLGRLFQRLLPGRPGAHHPREFARARGQRA
jgi:hypothetical protein